MFVERRALHLLLHYCLYLPGDGETRQSFLTAAFASLSLRYRMLIIRHKNNFSEQTGKWFIFLFFFFSPLSISNREKHFRKWPRLIYRLFHRGKNRTGFKPGLVQENRSSCLIACFHLFSELFTNIGWIHGWKKLFLTSEPMVLRWAINRKGYQTLLPAVCNIKKLKTSTLHRLWRVINPTRNQTPPCSLPDLQVVEEFKYLKAMIMKLNTGKP